MKRKTAYTFMTGCWCLLFNIFLWQFFGTESHLPYYIGLPISLLLYVAALNLARKHNRASVKLIWFGAVRSGGTYRYVENPKTCDNLGDVIEPKDGLGVWVRDDDL